MTSSKARRLVAAAWSLLAAACGSPAKEELGGVDVATTVSAAVAANVTRVVVTIDGAPRSAGLAHFTREVELLENPAGVWQGRITAIPVGDAYTVSAVALDVDDVVLFGGEATNVAVNRGLNTVLRLVLAQQTGPGTVDNAGPKITSVVASTDLLDPAEPLSLRAVASDPDGDSISYFWTATVPAIDGPQLVGAFDNDSVATPVWSAPDASFSGLVTFKLEVTDSRLNASAVSFAINVSPANARGTLPVEVTLNNLPDILAIDSTAGAQLAPGAQTTLFVQVLDADPADVNALTASWSADCGTFAAGPGPIRGDPLLGEPTVLQVSYTAPATVPASGACTISVDVSDGVAPVATTGTLTVNVRDLLLAYAPQFLFASQTQYASEDPLLGGVDNHRFTVTVRDPNALDVAFAWAAYRVTGTTRTLLADSFSQASDTGTESTRAWTAPTCAALGGAGTYAFAVAVTATDAFDANPGGTSTPNGNTFEFAVTKVCP